MITILKTDGTKEEVELPKSPDLAWLQHEVEGYIEIVNLDAKTQLICDEEGLLKQKPINEEATQLYREALKKKYQYIRPDSLDRVNIVGHAVLLTGKHICR